MKPFKVIVVDDETDNLDALERLFRKKYEFFRANSGDQALSILNENPDMAVIVTDQRMPSMTGVELLEKTITTHPQMVRLLLTGFTEIESIIAAVNQGHIFRYLTKPWDSMDLINSVEKAIEHFSRAQELERKNQELQIALNELKTLDDAKNKFMILINHELKTPLTVISSFLQILKETPLNQDQQMYLDRISRSSERLQDILDDTFILTHYVAGTLKPKLSNLVLSGLIGTALEGLATEKDKKNLTFKNVNPDVSVPALYIDPQLFLKIFKHLFGNAVRFSSPGSTIQWHIQFVPGQLTFSIENEGVRITNEILDRIEKPFNLQTDIMNHSKGMGLGLSVVNAILKIHRSHLEVQQAALDLSSNHKLDMADPHHLPIQGHRIRFSFSLRY